MKKILVVLLFFSMTLMSTASAQEVIGHVTGRVLDESGNPVAFAVAVVTGTELQGRRTSTSDSNGYIRILSLPVGFHHVEISHPDYQTLVYDDVRVELGRTTSLPEVRLSSRVDDDAKVIVVGHRPLIDPISTTVGYNLSAEEFSDLPLDRDYRRVPLLLPNVTESFYGDAINYAGATGIENKYYIDGIEVTNPFDGSPGMNLPYNFIQEIQVRTGGYEAEYRSSLGAILNVVTPKGGNEFHGQIFGFFNNNNLTGSARQATFEPEEGDFTQYDVGLGVDGPVIRDRLWFSGAYNPQFQSEDVAIPGLQGSQDKITRHIFAGKLSWQPAPQTNVAVALLGDPATRDAVGDIGLGTGPVDRLVNPDPWLSKIEDGNIAALLNAYHIVNDRVMLELATSYLNAWERRSPATERGAREVFFSDGGPFGASVVSGGVALTGENRSRQITVDTKATAFLGDHTVKAGAAYEDNHFDAETRWRMIFYGSFLRPPEVAENVYADLSVVDTGQASTRIASLFAQDSWLIRGRLRLNLGFRWDAQYLIDSNGDVAQKIRDQYQPRGGFIYEIGAPGSQRILGSAARFYHELPAHLPSQWHNAERTEYWPVYACDPRVEQCDPLAVYGSSSRIFPEVEGLEGQHFDEYTLGYERIVRDDIRVGVRGIHRTFQQGIESLRPTDGGPFEIGNPGVGRFSDWPKMERDYSALEFVVRKSPSRTSNVIGSYVFSKTRGNYTGLFATDYGIGAPNRATWDYIANLTNADGRLPNDRPHVLKLSGWYRFAFGLSAGGSFVAQSGTPTSELGPAPPQDTPFPVFLSQRGSVGRTPWLWDLNLRFGYDLPWRASRWSQRLLLDILHVASQRKAVLVEQNKLIGPADAPIANPDYGRALAFQPPMTIRFGTEFVF